MQLKLLQLPKVKLSFRQRLLFTAAVSAIIIISTCGLVVYLNSIPKESKGAIALDLFTATLNSTGSQVEIYWVTENEWNNSHFDIERSIDGITYAQLAQIPGAGNSSNQLTYSYTDLHPLPGISYYRLKDTDEYGKSKYGATQSVNNENAPPPTSINVYPLPASNFIFVEVATHVSSNTTISVVDVTGKNVKTINAVLYEGKNKIKLDISSLPNGIYFVSAEGSDGFKLSQKMIKTE